MVKAVILAAGVGSRLRPITDRIPKCLVKVDGNPILHWQLENLRGLDEIVLVLGYRSGMVRDYLAGRKGPRVTIVENADYETTNNIYSLHLARKRLYGEPFLLLNGDVYCDTEIYRLVLSDRRGNLVPYDSGFFDPEELKLRAAGGRAMEILPKRTGKGACNGSTIGMFKLGPAASRTMFDVLEDLMKDSEQRRHWFEHALNVVLKKTRFHPLDIVGFKWVEIDIKEDIDKADGFDLSRRS